MQLPPCSDSYWTCFVEKFGFPVPGRLLRKWSSLLGEERAWPCLNDAYWSVDLTLQIGYSNASVEGADRASSERVDFSHLIDQIAFLVDYFPYEDLPTLVDVASRYLLTSASMSSAPLTLLASSRPVFIEQLEMDIRLVAPNPTADSPTESGIPDLLEKRGVVVAARRIATRAEMKPVRHEMNAWGRVDVVVETSNPSAGLYVLQIAPRQSIPLHVHRVMHEREMVITAGLLSQNATALCGGVHHWGLSPHTYHNPTEAYQSVLCIDTPSFIPDDEILTDGLPATEISVEFAGRRTWGHLANHAAAGLQRRDVCQVTFYYQGLNQADRLSFGSWTMSDLGRARIFGFDPEGRLLLVRAEEGWELPTVDPKPGQSMGSCLQTWLDGALKNPPKVTSIWGIAHHSLLHLDATDASPTSLEQDAHNSDNSLFVASLSPSTDGPPPDWQFIDPLSAIGILSLSKPAKDVRSLPLNVCEIALKTASAFLHTAPPAHA